MAPPAQAAIEAWGTVTAAMASARYYRYADGFHEFPQFADPVTQRVVDALGWGNLCGRRMARRIARASCKAMRLSPSACTTNGRNCLLYANSRPGLPPAVIYKLEDNMWVEIMPGVWAWVADATPNGGKK